MPDTSHSPQDYTVAWICTLPREQAAVFLDEEHEAQPITRHSTTYLFGDIGCHAVVLACLPTMGSIPTATCVAQLENGFPNLRFILLVGIGGGAPTEKQDVRLDDIVVSYPNKLGNGILQYDFGTKFQDEHLEVRDNSLRGPSETLTTAIGDLDRKYQQSPTENLSQQLLDRVHRLARPLSSMQNCRRPDFDLLFRSEYRHREDTAECLECQCEESQLVAREPRDLPKIHKGLIASGNQVMRDAMERDRLANEKGVLCLEMEASGLRTELGWLVVRGICNYCDSHKNVAWQDHAAAMAAEYTRQLLCMVSRLKPEEDPSTSAESKSASASTVSNQSGMTMSGGFFQNFNDMISNKVFIRNFTNSGEKGNATFNFSK